MNFHPHSTLRPLLAGIVFTFAFVGSSALAATMTKDEYAAGKSRISASEKADKKACDTLSGNAKDVCEDESEGKAKIAMAELEAGFSGKPADMAKVAMVRAEANYEVAKERCDDLAGNPKDVCQQQAKTTLEKAKADAKLKEMTGKAQTEAMDTKREASLKLEVEKCDTLAGNAKSACVASAKSKLGAN